MGRKRPAHAQVERVSPFPRWWPWAVGLLAGGMAFLLYLCTLAPTVTFADSGELAAAVHFLDVAHPPGFPLYLLLGKLFTLLVPWGRPIVRLNAFSALGAALAVGLSGAALVVGLYPARRSGPAPRPGSRPPSSLPSTPRTFPFPALAAAGLLAVSRTFWEQATLTEVYALNMALAAGLLLLLMLFLRRRREGRTDRAERTAALAFFLSGLGLGNHLTLLFWAAMLFLAIWLEEGRAFWQWRRLLLRAGLFLLGLGIYLYLPLRAAAAPPFNWGDPQNWTRFLRHVTAAQYRANFSPGWSTWANQVGFFLPRFWDEFGPLPLLFFPLGWLYLFRREDRTHLPLAWATVLGASLVLFYALSYEIAEDQETYYMLFFLLGAVWIGYGMAWVLERPAVRRSRVAYFLMTASFILLILWPLLSHLPTCDRRSYTYAEAYVRDILEHLPPNAFVLTRHWNLFSPAYYLQQVEGLRPDVVLVDQELLRRTWYLETLARRWPWLATGAGPALPAYRVELEKFEEGRPYDFGTIQSRFQGLGNALIEAAMRQGRPVLLSPEVEYRYGETVEERYIERLLGQPAAVDGVGEKYPWYPEALLFRLGGEPPEALPRVEFLQPALRDGRMHDGLTRQIVERYARFWFWWGLYWQAAGECPRAVQAYEAALAISPTMEEARLGIASCR